MAKISRSVRKRTIERYNNRCFYTGLPLYTDVHQHHILKCTIDHLIPYIVVRKYPGLDRHALVLSGYQINRMLDVAPLQVRFNLKKYLSHEVKFIEPVSNNRKMRIYNNLPRKPSVL